MAAEGNGKNNRNRNTDIRPLWELHDNQEDPDHVDKFCQSDAPIYIGETPNDDYKSWIHEVKAVIEEYMYRPMSCVSLAVIQLRREVAVWWSLLNIDPWRITWFEFLEMFLAQFPPPTYLRGPSSRVEEAMPRFAMHHALFDQIVKGWGQIPNEWMVDYVERFERNFIQQCSYRLSENRKCHLFWHGVLCSIRIYVDYDLYDYYNLKTKVI